MRPFALLPLIPLTGCAGWPLADHLPAGSDPDALPAGADPAQAAQVDWVFDQPEAEGTRANGLPIAGVSSLGDGQGVLVRGELMGAGWAGDQPSDTAGTCGALAFPYQLDGSYAGDVDWVAVEVQEAGYLCARVEIDHPTARYDLVPYRLNGCDEPSEPLLDEDELTWGYGLEGPEASWAAPVPAGARIGVALAAFWPQDSVARIPWRIGLSATRTGPCPLLPETGS